MTPVPTGDVAVGRRSGGWDSVTQDGEGQALDAHLDARCEAQPAARALSPEELLALIDRVIAFARTGVRALDTALPG